MSDNKKAIIFGVRGRGIDCYLSMRNKYEIVAFADNDLSFSSSSQEIFGIHIIHPDQIPELKYDVIVISSQYYFDTIKDQLVKKLEVNEEQISDEFVAQYRSIEARWGFERNRVCDLMVNIGGRCKADKYEKRWQHTKEKYVAVKLYMIYEKFLGEFLIRVFTAIQNEKKEKSILSVFLPCYYDTFVCNPELIKLLSKRINIPYGEELLFWQYVLRYRFSEVDLSDFTKYMLRDQWPPIKWNIGEEIASLDNDDRMPEAKVLMRKWNLVNGEYVCIGTRSGNYLSKAMGSDWHFDFRNSHFSNYQLAIDYLHDKKIDTVKMGRNEPTDESIRYCFDYAGKAADDYMDLVLFSMCRFAIVTTSGMWQLPTAFGKPVLVVNATSYTIACGGIPFTDEDLYIPKKYKDTETGKYLSLREIVEIDRICENDGEKLHRNQIELVENTPEEILDATKEMIMRLNGQWVDSEEDEDNYKTYMSIINPLFGKGFEYQKYHSSINCDNSMEQVVEDMAYCFSAWENRVGNAGGPMPCRLATTWLRNNYDYYLK